MKLNQSQKDEFASLRVEILDLNVAAHFFIRKINRLGYIWQKTTRQFCLEEFIALRYLENGIILHLSNLDDDNSLYSFRAAQKSFNKANSNKTKDIKQLNEMLKTYRKNLNELKVFHRNHRIAHLNYNTDLRFDEFLKFDKQLLPLILEANGIADQFWGEKIKVHFMLGSLEGNLDFRKDTENLKIDINAVKGFN